MRISSGFDRLSTEEELHQVLAVLDQFGLNGWTVAQEGSAGRHAVALCADALEDDSADAESLAELMEKRPELKN